MSRNKTLNLCALIVAALIYASQIGCNSDQDRQEDVDKLRGIGVAASPEIATPSTATIPLVVTLTAYAFVPVGQTVVATPFVDSQGYGLPASDLVMSTDAPTYSPFGNLNLYTVKASFTAPNAAILAASGQQLLRLRYGIQLVANDRVEKMVGDVPLVAAGSDTLVLKPLDIVITGPGATAQTNTDVDITSNITNPNGEEVKLGWFASDGKITNRRAHDTKWNTTTGGTHMLAVTVHGLESRSFAMKVQTVVTP